jgi:hypothetical protein
VRSLLVAAALGLGLLAAGGTIDTAAAAPYRAAAPAGVTQLVTPVHYERRGYHRPQYVPPPRHHWHRYPPAPPPHHSWRHPRPYQYGSRY